MVAEAFSTWMPLILSFTAFLLHGVLAKPTIIELDHQPNGKNGDIKQLWASSSSGVYRDDQTDIVRNALKPNAHNKWDRNRGSKGHYIIPYEMTGTFNKDQKNMIEKAMKKIAKNSCLKFQKRSSVKGKHRNDFVDIQNKKGEGCYTTVGRFSGRNVLMLETNQMATCLVFPTVIHELLHVAGLWHEQMRYDRDKYIKVHYENIVRGTASQFEKVPEYASSTYKVHYDYKSVMHYKKDAFSRGGITMETKKKSFQNVIGSASDASKGDYTKICSIYNCPKCMGKTFKKNSQKKSSKKRKSRNEEGYLVLLRNAPLKRLRTQDASQSPETAKIEPYFSEDESEESSETMPLEVSSSQSDSIESIEEDSQDGDGRQESTDADGTKTFEMSGSTENSYVEPVYQNEVHIDLWNDRK